MSRLKVAWICHFSNQEMRNRLNLSTLWLKKCVKKLMGNNNPSCQNDFAPWVTNLILEFEKIENVELHVISPHAGLKTEISEFEMNGVNYHFFKPDMPFLHTAWPAGLSKNGKPNFKGNRHLVKRFLERVQPDVVNLIGTENPYYSITALDIDDIPVFTSAQTVYTNPNRKKLSGSVNTLNWDVELKIHKKKKYFGCSGRMHHDLIKKNNPDAIVFKNFFPIQKPTDVKDVPKEFDFVFFAAGVTPKKGIEDVLDALAIVKKSKDDVSLHVVGSCAPNYKSVLNQKIEELKLSNNVFFKSYFPVHSDMHQFIKKARAAVLPNKLDVISGTVIESMLLELPLVTYKTTGTPYLNKDGETVLLAEIGDIETLANHMLKLLNEPEYARNLAVKAKAFVETEFDNTKSAQRLLSCLRAVVDHYHHDKPIPEDLLFDLDEFPIYDSND